MAIETGIFGNKTNFEDRNITDDRKLKIFINACKNLGLKVVLVSGSFDVFHIGHAKYLEAAKKEGDILIVGIDSDKKITSRKGPDRPIVSEEERMQILAHCRHVDVIVLKKLKDSEFHLLKTIKPNVLIVSETTNHKKLKLEEMRKYCDKMVMLKPQAETSTTAKLRKMHIGGANRLVGKLIPELVELINKALKEI